MLEFCRRCKNEIILKSEGTGPSIQYIGTCSKCDARCTRSKDARTGKITTFYYYPEDEVDPTDSPTQNQDDKKD